MSTSGRIEPHPSIMVHPGPIAAEAIRKGMGLSVSEAARRMLVSRQQLTSVLAGRAGITPEMALRLGRLLGNGPHVWLAMQTAHDLAQAQASAADR